VKLKVVLVIHILFQLNSLGFIISFISRYSFRSSMAPYGNLRADVSIVETKLKCKDQDQARATRPRAEPWPRHQFDRLQDPTTETSADCNNSRYGI